MKGEVNLAQAWMSLRAAAPRESEAFWQVLQFISSLKADELVRAPIDSIYLLQGQARAYAELVKALGLAPSTLENKREVAAKQDSNKWQPHR